MPAAKTYGPAGLVIRAMEPEDAEGLWSKMNQPAVYAGTLQLPLRSKASRRALVERFVEDKDGHPLVAELDGQLVGSAGLHVHGSPRRRHAAGIGMSVHPDHHGRGIGSALLAALLDLADNWLNLRRIELDVYTDNAAAIALYTKFGFEVEGTFRDFAFRDGGWVDALTMARLRT